MCNAKINPIFILFLILQVQTGYGRPQGFAYFPIPVSWNNDFFSIVSNVEQSPVLSPFIYIFGIQNSVDNNIDILSKKEQQLDNTNKIEQGEDKLTVEQKHPSSINRCVDSAERVSNENNNTMKFPIDQEEKELNKKFNATFKNTTESDNKVDNAGITTESIVRTTIADIETTTDDVFDRGNAALVATMLG